MEMIDKGHGIFVTKCEFFNHGDHGCFWYKGCRFKFSKNCPKSIIDLKNMLVYRQDIDVLTDTDYLYLEKVLHLPSDYGIFYDELMETWKDLNEKDFIYLE